MRWADVDLGERIVHVRRRFYAGSSRSAEVTLWQAPSAPDARPRPSALATPRETRAGDDDLVFTASGGGRVNASNLMSRVLKPAAVEAGLGEWVREGRKLRAESWVGFHTFRHTCATILFRRGWNAVQVQRWLGHHKPSFTLDTYVHLLPEDVPEPTFFDSLIVREEEADEEPARRAGRAAMSEAPFDPRPFIAEGHLDVQQDDR